MFSEWISQRSSIEESFGSCSVLQSYPGNVGRDIATNIIRSLHYLPSERSNTLKTKEQLDWTMEVICYGLTLPMTEIDLIKNCAYLYIDWTSVISNQTKSNIPKPIVKEKTHYFKKMLKHLTNLFFPRDGASNGLQAKLCSQVLYHVKTLADIGKPFQTGIWEDLLIFFLGIAGHLLSPPSLPGGLAEHLCDQLINSLFFVWLLACCGKFPSPPLWSTLQDFCLSWRHHKTLISQWSKLMCSLTLKVLQVLYGPHCLPEDVLKEDDRFTLPNDMAPELTVQCWFRFLHLFGTPVALSMPHEITNNQYFMQYALEQGLSPIDHPSISSLPDSFLKAMKGVSLLVDMFLDVRYVKQGGPGEPHETELEEGFNRTETSKEGSTMSPSSSLDMLSSILTIPGPSSPIQKESSAYTDLEKAKAKARSTLAGPGVNSILHVFGSWLFDATLSSVDMKEVLRSFSVLPKELKCTRTSDAKRASPSKDNFEHGRAEAFSILCHIFCCQKSGETILPIYLARFYLSMAIGLCYHVTRAGHVLSNILTSSKNILKIDLQGVHVLVPHIIKALEITLSVSDKDLNLGNHHQPVELRRSSIRLLLSMLCMPLHFLSVTIEPICGGAEAQDLRSDGLTFLALKPHLTSLLTQALDVETDPNNMQMLLGGAMLLIQDTVAVEQKKTMMFSSGTGPEIIIDSHIDNDDYDNDAMKRSKTISQIRSLSDDNAKKDEKGKKDSEKTNNEEMKTMVGFVGDSKDLSTTKGLFVHMVTLLCEKLMFAPEWRADMNVTLSALELLSGLAQLDAKFIDMIESKKCVKWICNYIEYQANKAAPLHVRDLHSIIVAAFNCLSQWILNHHWLLEDESCLNAFLEVVELGISGTKSKTHATGFHPVMKGEKELKPASFRVREAAEGVLAYIMEQTGNFPTPSGPASLSTLLDEERLLTKAVNKDRKKFLYFAIDASCIVSMLEDTVDQSSVHLPSVTSIIRGPTGKTASLMQLRFFARSKQDLVEAYLNEPPQPTPLDLPPQIAPANQRYYPEAVDLVEKVQAELSIPELNEIAEDSQNEAQDQIKEIMKLQSELERTSEQIAREERYNMVDQQRQPTPQSNFKASRLYLSHLGILNLSAVEKKPNRSFARLLRLNSSDGAFENSLKTLDRLSNRSYDTMYVFIVRKGQRDGEEIINNEITAEDSHFVEFITSLGWPVTIGSHSGWTGQPSTSWMSMENSNEQSDAIGSQILYYSDVATELAIIVPALNLKKSNSSESASPELADEQDFGSSSSVPSLKRSESEDLPEESEYSAANLARQFSDPSENQKHRRHTTQECNSVYVDTKSRDHSSQSETKVVVAWLQDFNDHNHFPINELINHFETRNNNFSQSQTTSATSSRVPEKEICIIFIHPLKTGLFRIKIKSVFGSHFGGPLVNGMVLGRRVLGTMTRNTAINICRRRRLEIDNYSPPHVCRKIKIQEIIKKFAKESSVPEFYASTFSQDMLPKKNN
eukprot:gene19837-21779_t